MTVVGVGLQNRKPSYDEKAVVYRSEDYKNVYLIIEDGRYHFEGSDKEYAAFTDLI